MIKDIMAIAGYCILIFCSTAIVLLLLYVGGDLNIWAAVTFTTFGYSTPCYVRSIYDIYIKRQMEKSK